LLVGSRIQATAPILACPSVDTRTPILHGHCGPSDRPLQNSLISYGCKHVVKIAIAPLAKSISMTPVRLADDDPVRSGSDVVLSGVTVTGLNTVGNLCLFTKLLTPAK
jgi:hypothetical protein